MNKIVRYEKTILAESDDTSFRDRATTLKKSLFHRNSDLARQKDNFSQSNERSASPFRTNLPNSEAIEKSKTLNLLFVPDQKSAQIPGKLSKLEFSDAEEIPGLKSRVSGEGSPARGILKKESTINSPKNKAFRKRTTKISQFIHIQSDEKPLGWDQSVKSPKPRRRPPSLITYSKAKVKEKSDDVPSPFLFEKSKEKVKVDSKTRIYTIFSKFGKTKAKNQTLNLTQSLSKDQHAMIRDNATLSVKPQNLNMMNKRRGDSYQYLWKFQSHGPRSRAMTFSQRFKTLVLSNPIEKMRLFKKRLQKDMKGPYTPDSKRLLCWELLIMLMILSEFVSIPLTLAFDLDQILALSVLNILENIFFIFDIIFKFNTGFYKKGILILNRRRIAKRYLKFWFWIDFLLTFPFEYAIPNEDRDIHSSFSISPGFSTTTLIVRLLKVARLIRAFRIANIFAKFESYIAVSPAVTSLINFMKLLLINLIIAHWIACLWHLTALLEIGKAHQTWLASYGIVDRDWRVKYIFSLYWATTTMITVGYGDITPATPAEKVLAMITMIVAGGVFANTMNSINEILAGLNNTTELYRY